MTSHNLMDGEAIRIASGIATLCYHRRGSDASAPLVIFIPGGGHLARVAYGYPGGARRDFLDHWLEEAGYGLLAVSAPSGPPFTPVALPDLTRDGWAAAIAELAAGVITEAGGARSVVILAWSMGSSVVGQLTVSLRGRGIDVAGFMPLAASQPLPRSTAQVSEELLLENGLWDVTRSRVFGVERAVAWIAEIEATEDELGRRILPAEEYRQHFWVGTPIGLRRGGLSGGDEHGKEPDFALLPLAAPIVPTSQKDFRHPISDIAGWTYVNTQIVLDRYTMAAAAHGRELPDAAWQRLLALVKNLPERLTARVAGAHLFFIGERGARETVEAVLRLLVNTAELEAELPSLLRSAEVQTIP